MTTVEVYTHWIFNDNDPERAVKDMFKLFPNPAKEAIAMYGLWVLTRQSIVKQDKYKDPEYPHSIMELVQLVESKEDVIKLLKLLDCPLRDQHRVQAAKKPYLSDRRMDRIFKTITPVLPPFYRFVLPPEIYAYRQELCQINDELRQKHAIGNPSSYTIPEEDANEIVERSLRCVQDPIESTSDYYNNVAALEILSGRRNYEILCSLFYTPSSHPFQANVVGIAKKRRLEVDDYETHTIPLLCEYKLFEAAMDRVRGYKKYTPDSDDATKLSALHSRNIANATARLFGRRLSGTDRRNLYAEMAWRRRNRENHFLIGDRSCSKHTWFAKALCHEFSLDTTTRYQNLTIG